MRMVVVLPAPLGPRKPKISPRRTVKLTRSTAVKLSNCLTNSTASMAWSLARAKCGVLCTILLLYLLFANQGDEGFFHAWAGLTQADHLDARRC